LVCNCRSEPDLSTTIGPVHASVQNPGHFPKRGGTFWTGLTRCTGWEEKVFHPVNPVNPVRTPPKSSLDRINRPKSSTLLNTRRNFLDRINTMHRMGREGFPSCKSRESCPHSSEVFPRQD